MRNSYPSVRKAAQGAVNAFLRRLLTAREYRGYRVSDVPRRPGSDTAFCFSDLLRRLIDAEELDLDLPALQEVSKIAQHISMHANGSDDDVSFRDGPCGFGSVQNERFAASMDRYRNIPPQVTQLRNENRLTCVDYARIVGNHDSVAAAVIAEERSLVRAYRHVGDIRDEAEFLQRLTEEDWEVSDQNIEDRATREVSTTCETSRSSTSPNIWWTRTRTAGTGCRRGCSRLRLANIRNGARPRSRVLAL